MAENKSDLEEFARAGYGRNGYHETRGFFVKGIGGDQATRLSRALEHPSVPRYNDPHRTRKGVRVLDVSATPADGDGDFFVVVEYGVRSDGYVTPEQESDPTVVRLSATVQPELVTLDKDGEQIIVSYTQTLTDADGNRTPSTKTRAVQVEVPRPQILVSATRITRANPRREVEDLFGAVNRYAIWGYPERTLLAVRLESETRDRGLSYEQVWEFQYNKNTWDGTAVYTDDDGRIPTDLVVGEGIKRVRALEEVDFGRLGFQIR